ncbi:uncharacterized protein RHIMIDRAFT_282299 [Rhizopus microsporus ATCC 52813]|uniref:Gem-associated protein 7 n=1 Tax=Rhizopus microsporus ATCC 52813 TaxID=1340429 RepID=A0A2G4SUP8_RHIZD|nr:uncharacterized protein RHIMIDRAFT_282299 [Rhizopus microsporus ATCC 52813]PHZ12503.1 hypothetical protein RHIMIDRAFT_282299 [Rhizopus microsporus ATCC 52813]
MSDAEEKLRDRYLQLWLSTIKESPTATFQLHGGITVQGKLRATDSENNRFRVDRLESPMGTYDRAVIRGTDINVIEWDV